jgi:hypothetical protein
MTKIRGADLRAKNQVRRRGTVVVEEDVESSVAGGRGEAVNDSVRMYLREIVGCNCSTPEKKCA